MLYGNLDNNHFKYFQRKGLTTAVEVFIWREDDTEAAEAVQYFIDEPTDTSG